jgi:hypothetical protein
VSSWGNLRPEQQAQQMDGTARMHESALRQQ